MTKVSYIDDVIESLMEYKKIRQNNTFNYENPSSSSSWAPYKFLIFAD